MSAELDRIEASIFIDAPLADVWEALTDLHTLGHWFGSVFDDTGIAPGVELWATMEGGRDDGGRWSATVESLEPGRLLSWRWSPGPAGAHAGEPLTLVTLSLAGEGDGARLTVVETGFAAFTPERRDLLYPMNRDGWDATFAAISDWFAEDGHDESGTPEGELPTRLEASIVIHAPRARVWQALTDPKQLGVWFNVALENDVIAPGVELRGAILHPGFEHITWRATIEAVEPPRLLSWRWHPGAADPSHDYTGEAETLCTFVLDEDEAGASTRVAFSESGFDQLPPDRWAEGLGMNEDGWPMVLQAIADALGG